MQKLSRIGCIVAIFILTLPGMVGADPVPLSDGLPKDIIITEVQTENEGGSEEFIEFYNNSGADIDFSGSSAIVWNLQYFSSTKVKSSSFDWSTTTPTGSLQLTGMIPAGGYYIFSSTPSSGAYHPGSVVPDQSFAGSHFADSGGIKLISINSSSGSPITETHDYVGWLETGTLPDGFYRTPSALGSLQRQVNDDGSYIDESGNLNLFVGSATISPDEAWAPPEEPEPEPEPEEETPAPSDDEEPPATEPESPDLIALQLTELLPNPAPPATDADDEFVEIHNPNAEAVDLQGYTIQTGSTYGYSYVMTGGTIDPSSYLTLTSGGTNLALANSGGKARLLNPAGETISETTAYEKAPDGQAWALIGGVWQWTTTPTPAAANILTLPVPKASTKKTTTKTTKAKTASAKTKKSSVKAASTKKQAAVPAEDGYSETEEPPAVHPSILAGGSLSALLYAGYEYKTDAVNKIHKLRRYRAARRALGQKA